MLNVSAKMTDRAIFGRSGHLPRFIVYPENCVKLPLKIIPSGSYPRPFIISCTARLPLPLKARIRQPALLPRKICPAVKSPHFLKANNYRSSHIYYCLFERWLYDVKVCYRRMTRIFRVRNVRVSRLLFTVCYLLFESCRRALSARSL
jgi:hypothetical protein